jgi:hypothetical protein
MIECLCHARARSTYERLLSTWDPDGLHNISQVFSYSFYITFSFLRSSAFFSFLYEYFRIFRQVIERIDYCRTFHFYTRIILLAFCYFLELCASNINSRAFSLRIHFLLHSTTTIFEKDMPSKKTN